VHSAEGRYGLWRPGHAILCAFLSDESPPSRLDSGRQVIPVRAYIHAYTPAHTLLPTMGIARVRLHVYPTRDGRAPGRRLARAESSCRVSFSSFVSRFAPGKVLSGVHWEPIDKGCRSSTFLSLVSLLPPPPPPPPPASGSAIYMAWRVARAGDGITSFRRTCAFNSPSVHSSVFSVTLFCSLLDYRSGTRFFLT